jgi:hypothetical protein
VKSARLLREHEPGETHRKERPRRLTGEPAEREPILQKSKLNNYTAFLKKGIFATVKKLNRREHLRREHSRRILGWTEED